MTTAIVFPGHGSQYVGMGKDLYEKHSQAKEMFDAADTIVGYALSRICFEGPEETLRQTKHTQPAIFLHSIVLSKFLTHIPAIMTGGHSVGEYAALVYAGVLSFEDGLKLVQLRGELMQCAGELHRGTMAAIVGLDEALVEQVCSDSNDVGIVQCANYNSPGQVVISGSVDGVKKAMSIAKERGAKLVKELVVSGAFHSPLMQPAYDGLHNALAEIKFADAKIPVYANVTAQPVTKADEIRLLLEKQILAPVRWEESVRNMGNDGATHFVEVGPGKVLQGLIKRIKTDAQTFGVDKEQDIKGLQII